MSSGVEKTILLDEYNVKSRVSQAYSTFFALLKIHCTGNIIREDCLCSLRRNYRNESLRKISQVRYRAHTE